MLFDSFSTSFGAASWTTYPSMSCEAAPKSVKNLSKINVVEYWDRFKNVFDYNKKCHGPLLLRTMANCIQITLKPKPTGLEEQGRPTW